MTDFTYCDIKVTDSFDFSNQEIGDPQYIYDLDVIKQDIRHALLESGLLEQLIGERSIKKRAVIYNKIRSIIESDERIVAGSSSVDEDEDDIQIVSLYAKTIKFGAIGFRVGEG